METATNKMPESKALISKILDIAASRFGAKGYYGTTTQEIADAAGVTKGALYYHLPQKNAILYYIHETILTERLKRWTSVSSETTQTVEKLRSLILSDVTAVAEKRDWYATINLESKFLDNQFQSEVRAWRESCVSVLESIISSGVEEGTFATAAPRRHALIVITMLDVAYRWFGPKGTMTPDRLAAHLTDLVLRGIRPAAQPV